MARSPNPCKIFQEFGSGNSQDINLLRHHPMPSTLPSWTNASLQNSWYNFDTTNFNTAQYRKLDCGRVEIRGLIRKGSSAAGNEVLFTLPSGSRPAKTEIHPVSTWADGNLWYAKTGRVDISPSGDVKLNAGYTDANISGGSTSYVSLDGLYFYV